MPDTVVLVICILKKITLHASIKLSDNKPSVFLMTGIWCDNLQCNDSAYYKERMCRLQEPTLVCQVFCDELFSPYDASTQCQHRWNNFNGIFNIGVHAQ